MKLYDDQFIVITGGAGFIGSCLIRHLNDLGLSNIVVVDDLGKSEKWKNLVGKRYAHFIAKQKFFDWLVDREASIEAFVHLGACANTLETDASYLLDNNYQFSVQLAEYALRNSQRFIYASSAATYGDGSLGFSDSHKHLESFSPLNMYGYSKHMFDLWIKNQGALDKVVGLKFFNVFGPNEFHKGRMSSAIVHFLNTIQKDGRIRLFKSSDPSQFKDGEQKRDFIYVKDVVKMIADFLENDAKGIFNIGSGIATTWNQMANAVFKALGKAPQIDYIDMPQDLVGKYQNFTKAEMDKARKSLHGLKVSSFDDSVIEYVQEYLLPGKRW